MFDNLKKKLKSIFKRKASPVPKEVVENKDVQKAVVKFRRKKRWRRIRNFLLASAAVSALVQYNPQWVAKPYDQYMADKGFDADLKSHYNSKAIYVYDRYNPLYPFHVAGNEMGTLWHEGLKEKHSSVVGMAIETPFVLVEGLWKGFTDMIPGNKLDAYSMANNDDVATRTVFIRPPGDFSVQRFLSDFSGIDAKHFKFQNDPVQLQNALFEFVMLHEARHGDQDKMAYVTANESDADLYAFKVMKARGTDPKLLKEVEDIVLNARSVNALLRGDDMHVSTFTILRGSESIFDSHEDAAAFNRLASILREADEYNDAILPADMPAGNRYYYLTAALYQRSILDSDPDMKDAAATYLHAIQYFNNMAGGHMIDRKFDLGKVDFGYLNKEYKPAPDRLDVPQQKPPRPNS